jgi:hypothetical protein
MPSHHSPVRRRYRRPADEISHLFASETRALIAQSAFVLAMPVLIVLAVTTKNLVWAGVGWGTCLAVVVACWLLPKKRERQP